MPVMHTVFTFAREATEKDREHARIYAKYHAHDLYGDTRINRVRNCVDTDKEAQLIESIIHNTDLWWNEGIGICEDNIYFSGKEKVFKFEGKWYITIPELEMKTHIISGMNRVFHARKEIKKCLGEKFINLPSAQKDAFTDFWIKYPNGVVVIGNIAEIRKKSLPN